MQFKNIIKGFMTCIVASAMFLCFSQEVQCQNFTNMEEYMKWSNEQAALAGYETINAPTEEDIAEFWANSGGTRTSSGQKDNSKTFSAPVKTCDHEYTDSIIKEATCVEEGMMESKCSKCGNTYKTAIPATGKHEYTTEITKEATCTEDGVTTYTCTVCGDSYTEEIPATGHKYNSSVVENATCITPGTRVYICEYCDDSYTEEIQATGHGVTVEEVTKEPGMFTPGEKVEKCSTCGEILSTAVVDSQYPITVLYVVIGCAVALAIVIAALLVKSKKRSIKSLKKAS